MWLYDIESFWISKMQILLQDYDEVMLILSRLCDPRSALLLLFPVLLGIDQLNAPRILWVAAFAEWVNALLKWLFSEHRPYWWVHISSSNVTATLQQYRLTCETGPGSPSGHLMVTAAAYAPFVYFILKEVIPKSSRLIVSQIGWMSYGLFLLLSALSRCFIATHFPHQVVLGAVIGGALGILAVNIDSNKLTSPTLAACFGAFIIPSSVLFYYTLQVAGIDPGFSIPLAEKYCANQAWVHADTTPFYALCRDAGSLIGLSLGIRYVTPQPRDVSSFTARLLRVLGGLALARGLESLHLPRQPVLLFYTLSLFYWVFLVFALLTVVPRAVDNVLAKAIGPPRKYAKH